MANLKNITELPVVESADGLNLIVNDNGAAKQIAVSAVGVQADFAVSDENSPAFIKNKPQVAQADWSEIDESSAAFVKNKPFYDTREYGNNTITFDGNITGKETISLGEQNGASAYLVKLSDRVATYEEVVGGSATMVEDGNARTVTITEDMLEVNPINGMIADPNGTVIIVPENGELNGLSLTKGIWSLCVQVDGASAMYISNLSWYGAISGELKKLDAKYLPDGNFVIRVNPDTLGEIAAENLSFELGCAVELFEKILNGDFVNVWLDARYMYGDFMVGYMCPAVSYHLDENMVDVSFMCDTKQCQIRCCTNGEFKVKTTVFTAAQQ